MGIGIVELLVFVFALAFLVLPVWTAIDAALKPDLAWKAIGQNKVVWVLVNLFTSIIGPLVYLAVIRPRLRAIPLAPL